MALEFKELVTLAKTVAKLILLLLSLTVLMTKATLMEIFRQLFATS
jgi:hypothetical protein